MTVIESILELVIIRDAMDYNKKLFIVKYLESIKKKFKVKKEKNKKNPKPGSVLKGLMNKNIKIIRKETIRKNISYHNIQPNKT